MNSAPDGHGNRTMQIRTATVDDAFAIAQIHVATWNSSYRDLLPAATLERQTIERRHASWTAILHQQGDSQVTFVMESPDDGVIGFVSAGPARHFDTAFSGEIYALYLLEAHQQQGLGRALFLQAMSWLSNAGHQAAMLWVLSSNPAVSFYQRMGGIPLRTKTEQFDEMAIEETAYGWTNLNRARPQSPTSEDV